MKRAEKEAFVQDFRSRVEQAPVIYLTDFTGLDVKAMTTLRQDLKRSGADYLVVKNRLARLALEGVEDFPDLEEALRGPTGIVFGYEGPVEPAKAVAEFAEDHEERPVFKAGVLERAIVSPEEIERLAKLPPREQLLAELAGALEAPLVALAGALEAKVREAVGLFEALRRKREEEGDEG